MRRRVPANGPGSSPLTRGKPADWAAGLWDRGLIPAHAGKTPCSRARSASRPAHPRSRGENSVRESTTQKVPGSSPLTRGKRQIRDERRDDRGLIPAHAGKTFVKLGYLSEDGAHPRSRGENPLPAWTSEKSPGSSPLTRGKPIHGDSLHLVTGLIPAHAGKTYFLDLDGAVSGAHPRSRGENMGPNLAKAWLKGSSPLTRGKPAEPHARGR